MLIRRNYGFITVDTWSTPDTTIYHIGINRKLLVLSLIWPIARSFLNISTTTKHYLDLFSLLPFISYSHEMYN